MFISFQPNTSPAKKKARKVSFETSTPIRLEENNHVENNNDCSIDEEPAKKKSKKKKKEKDKPELTPMQDHLINNIRANFGK